MPDRAVCEREPEYRKLMVGHRQHKGEITATVNTQTDTKADPYQDPAYNRPPAVNANPEAPKNTNVRKRVSRFLKDLMKQPDK